MNDQPENMIAGGQRFKRSQLQDFVDGLTHQPTIKPVDLLKIKHLFYSSLRLKIDFRNALNVLGIKEIPESLDALKCLILRDSEIDVINSLYDAQRSIDEKDPQLKIPYSVLVASDKLKTAVNVGFNLNT